MKYVAWLRAINVGGHVVKMEQLRRIFEGLGFSNVQTFIASGNVIFESSARSPAALETKIEAALQKALGYPVVTFLRSSTEVATIAAYAPFPKAAADPTSALYVYFVRTAPAARALARLTTELDDFHVNGREVYWLRRKYKERAGEPGPPLDRVLVGPATNRNITTVRKLAAKFCAEG